ncbi:MAG: sigma-70 family RNA polymerase sigma factor [Verrucomicrobiota bacterium]
MKVVPELHSPNRPSGPATGASDTSVFATTHWSVVRLAGEAATSESTAALDRLCRQYWQPLYYFVRRKGYAEADAKDLVQGFFERILESGLVGAADRERGRFRSFLLRALENYVMTEWNRAHRQKRGGGREIFSLDDSSGAEAAYSLLPPDTRTPVQIFEHRWAQAILENVMARLREEVDGRGGQRYEVLKQFLFCDRGETSYAEAAEQIGLSESATKSAIYRLRQRYGELFAYEVAQTVERPEDVDEEINYIMGALSSR